LTLSAPLRQFYRFFDYIGIFTYCRQPAALTVRLKEIAAVVPTQVATRISENAK